MNSYVFWTNKGGVGKTTLTHDISIQFSRTYPDADIILVDLSDQMSLSSFIMNKDKSKISEYIDKVIERESKDIHSKYTISGYFINTISKLRRRGKFIPKNNKRRKIDDNDNDYNNEIEKIDDYLIKVNDFNDDIPPNVKLLHGSYNLNIIQTILTSISNQIDFNKTQEESWIYTHSCLRESLNQYIKSTNKDVYIFIDTDPNINIYTEIALCTADKLIIPLINTYPFNHHINNTLKSIYGKSSLSISFASQANEFKIPLPKLSSIIIDDNNNDYSISLDSNKFNHIDIESIPQYIKTVSNMNDNRTKYEYQIDQLVKLL